MKIVSKYHRTATERRFLFRMLTSSLILHGQIKTTAAKAKEMRRFADRLINLAQQGDQHSRRQAEAFLFGAGVTNKLFNEFPTRFPVRRSGFTRVRLAGFRKGDKSEMAYIEFVEPDVGTILPKQTPIAADGGVQSKKTEDI